MTKKLKLVGLIAQKKQGRLCNVEKILPCRYLFLAVLVTNLWRRIKDVVWSRVSNEEPMSKIGYDCNVAYATNANFIGLCSQLMYYILYIYQYFLIKIVFVSLSQEKSKVLMTYQGKIIYYFFHTYVNTCKTFNLPW